MSRADRLRVADDLRHTLEATDNTQVFLRDSILGNLLCFSQ